MISQKEDQALMELANSFRDALHQCAYLVRRFDSDGELTTSALSTLGALLNGGLRVGEVATGLGVKMPSLTEQVIKLERAGLARRGTDPDDCRAVRVVLTAEGRCAVAAEN